MADEVFSPALRVRIAIERALALAVMRRPRLVALLARRRPREVDGRALDPQTAAMLALDDVQKGSDMTRVTPAEARLRMAHQVRTVDALPTADVHTREERAGASRVRIYTPEGLPSPSPAILFIHGGGWVVGSISTHDGVCRALAKGARARVFSLDYRLAPEHRFPAAVEDSVAAFRWLAKNAARLGVDPARIAVAGDSAGGNLSAVVSNHTRGDAHPPALQVLLYPATDAASRRPSREIFADHYYLSNAMIDWYLEHYARGVDPRNPDFSPIYTSDLKGVAPALVYTAGFDPLRDEGEAYADRLREVGALVAYREYRELIHGFVCTTGILENAARALDEIAADVRRELYRERTAARTANGAHVA
jgi:acetyl esterase